ncbi:GNAT family N-acetyltransferase [Paludibacter sp. 221]|uniref:GNAT family N-acetyltransferase n=1 Tax=Paludibacter sp. 221 TaxID=2302939 RepID=UPI0013D42C73|nr:GNAT family N-acetyltransferase [Paludibacter sp. 221]NDV46237.1 GNAT family N-acetyltransferase [Paludibacter sp. 221]
MKIIEVREFSIDYYHAVEKLIAKLTNSPASFSESFFKEIVSSPNSYFFLLLDEGSVAGMLTIGTYKSPTGVKGWIEDVVVDEQYRGKGLGKKIMEHALSFTKSLGVDTLMLTSNPSRIAANKLYHSLGFEQKETNVYKMVFGKITID